MVIDKIKYIVPAKEEFIYEPRKLTTIIKLTVGDVEEVTIEELKDIENKWAIEANGELYYKGKNKKSLLKPDIEEDDRFRCMNSMRSVEKQSGIYLMGETV